jgi:hypothetical protein
MERFDPEHVSKCSRSPRRIWAKKPQHLAGVVSLFAVTHQGSAQGGKAEGSKLPEAEFNKLFQGLQVLVSNCHNLSAGIEAQFSL